MKRVLIIVLVFVLLIVAIVLLGDLEWCVDNYAPGDIGHCMLYENNLFGRFLQPELVCYSTEFR